MIHLFGKVYVTYIEKFVGPQDESRLPEAFARIVDRGLGYIEDKNYDKKLVCAGKNLKDVIGQFENENDMFNKFKDLIDKKFSPKFILYCDENAMLELLIRWWKFIFPNIDADAAYCLYSNFSENQTLRGLRKSTFLNITEGSYQISWQDFVTKYWSENKQIFKDKFNSYPAFELDNDFKKTASIEFHILNYLVSGNLSENLEIKLQDFFKKELINEITKIIEDCQDNLYQLDLKQEVYFSEDKTIKNLLKDNTYKIIFDKNIKNNSQGYEYLKNNYEFIKICKDLLNINSTIGKNEELSNFDYPCIHYVVEKGLDVNFKEILDNQLNSVDNLNILNNLIHKTRLNGYLVPSFLNRIKVMGKQDSIVSMFKF